MQERKARGILERLNEPRPLDHPVFELLDLAARVQEWEAVLRERLAELESLETTDRLGTERERALILLYERALDRSARLLTDLAKLDLKARAIAIEQERAALVMAGVIKAVHRAGLGDHEPELRTEIAAVFREQAAEGLWR